MKKFRVAALAVTVTAGLSLAFCTWRIPAGDACPSRSFDTGNVISDIRVISKDHHSVIHPEERTQVRDYLVSRLRALGSEPEILVYPGLEARGYSFDASCIVAEFPPLAASPDTTWLMMTAHYDSRYPWVPVRDSVCSYGAADDGYGLGVTLECARVALEGRKDWKQGLRILFTDAEEVGMVGMKAVYADRKDLFDDVGMIINVEARGPFGPALLFETSGDSGRILDLYSQTGRPYTYSLTNVVYGFMPNFTDFTVVKDSIPGMNFSTVADINHYHTDLDRFDAVNPESIAHYGRQIVPVMERYLCGEEYSDRDFLRGGGDGRVFFTVPLLGLLEFSRTGYLVLNAAVLLVFLLLVVLNRRNLRGLGVRCLSVLGTAVAALACGLALTWLACLVTGAEFKPFGIIAGIGFDNALMAVSCAVLFVLIVRTFLIKDDMGLRIFATMTVLAVLSAVLLALTGENLLFLIPLSAACISILLWQLSSWRVLLIPGILLVTLHGASFLHTLAMALTVGAFGLVLMIAALDMLVLTGLCGCFLLEKEGK